MRALVTGGNGFIGSWVCRELVQRGNRVRVLTKEGTPLDNLVDLKVDLHRGDILSLTDLQTAMEGCDAVFHLAALHLHWMRRWDEMYRVNVDGTDNVLRVAAETGVKRVVHTSTQNTVGQPASGPATEACAFNLWEEASHYTRSKVLAERKAMEWGQRGLDVVIVNPSGPFGPGDLGPGPTGKVIVDYMKRKFPFTIDGMFNAIDVADLAHAHVQAWERGRSGERYLLGGHDVTISGFFAQLARLTGIPAPRFTLPQPVALLAAHVMEFTANHVTHKPPKLGVDRIKQRGRIRHLDCSKAQRELGLRQTPLEQTLQDAIQWFREHGYVP